VRTNVEPYRGRRVRGRLLLGRGHVGQVLDDFLRVLSLACTRLASAENALILTV
jgi:hypothetical protein